LGGITMLLSPQSVASAVLLLWLVWAASASMATARAVPQLGAGRAAGSSDLNPSHLRCEYRIDPPGIDVTVPRLSWIVESPARGPLRRGQAQARQPGPPAAVLSPHDLPGRATPAARDPLRHRAGDLRHAPQRPARRRRLL